MKYLVSIIIIVVGIFILGMSYANVNTNTLSLSSPSQTLSITSAYPSSTSLTTPTLFPANESNTNVSISAVYSVGSSQPTILNAYFGNQTNVDVLLEWIQMENNPNNNFNAVFWSPGGDFYQSASVVNNNGTYQIIISAKTSFNNMNSYTYQFKWSINLKYEINSVVYSISSNTNIFYGKFTETSVLNPGVFLIHKFVNSWTNPQSSTWTKGVFPQMSGWTLINGKSLTLQSGEYIIIYDTENNINFQSAEVELYGDFHILSQSLPSEFEFGNVTQGTLSYVQSSSGSTIFYATLNVTQSGQATFLLKSTNSPFSPYETEQFNVPTPQHNWIGVIIGAAIIGVGLYLAVRKGL